jgi:hypothetical protein
LPFRRKLLSIHLLAATTLRRTYLVIAFAPESPQLYSAGQKTIDEAQELCETAQTPLPQVTGQTLYQALDAFGKYVQA